MYRLLLRAFPREFRRDFGAEMADVFHARRRDARAAGAVAHLIFLFRTVVDIARHGTAERRAARHRRGDSPMRSFMQDIRFALRFFRRRPAFTTAAVLTLALGIGINVAAFSIVDGVLLRWLKLPRPEQVVRLAETDGRAKQPLSAPSFSSLRDSSRNVFQSLAAYRVIAATLTGSGDAVSVPIAYVSPQFFDVIGVAPVLGRPLTDDDAANGSAVVIAQRFWRGRLGGDPAAVGRTLEINDTRVTIVGVMPDFAVFPANAEMWRPLVLTPEESRSIGNRGLLAIGRLKPGLDVATANAMMAHANNGYPDDSPYRKFGAAVINLRDDSVEYVRNDLLFVQGVALIVLLIGCANVANLLLAAASARQHELSIRAAIGAGRRRLIRQLLAESLALSSIAGAIGLVIAMWLAPAVLSAYPLDLPGLERINISLRELALAFGAAVGTTLLFGLVPAILASCADLSAVLRSGPRTGSTRLARGFRWALVSSEVVLTLTLLAGAALLVRNYSKLTSQPIGFDPNHVLTAQIVLPASRYPDESSRRAAFDRAIDSVRRQPGVVDVATTMPLSFDGIGMGEAFKRVDGAASDALIVSSSQKVSDDYLRVFRVPLLRGRFFTTSDTVGSQPVLVVNEQFAAKYSPGRDVIGTRLSRNGKIFEVIGVVADGRFNYYQKPKPFVLMSTNQEDTSVAKLAVRTIGDPDDFARTLQSILRGIDPKIVTAPLSLEALVGKTVAQKRFNMSMLTGLACLAVVLAVIGIYGVMSYVVSQQEREMGIRLALGARPSSVQRLMVGQGLKPMLAGIAGGLGGAWYLTTLLRRELFEMTPHDPWPLALVAIGLLGVGLLACWIPSRRAARIDPASTLRAT